MLPTIPIPFDNKVPQFQRSLQNYERLQAAFLLIILTSLDLRNIQLIIERLKNVLYEIFPSHLEVI